jgi:hypothetical protein
MNFVSGFVIAQCANQLELAITTSYSEKSNCSIALGIKFKQNLCFFVQEYLF